MTLPKTLGVRPGCGGYELHDLRKPEGQSLIGWWETREQAVKHALVYCKDTEESK